MPRKISKTSLLRLTAAYAEAFPKEVAEELGKVDLSEAAQLMEAWNPGVATDVLEELPDARCAALLSQLADDGFERLIHRVHRQRLDKLKTLEPSLARRLAPKPNQA